MAILGGIILLYSGGFVLPFVYCRACKRMAWHQCIAPSVLGLIAFIFLAITIADLSYEALRVRPVAATAATIAVVAAPYLLSFWLIFRQRRRGGRHGIRSSI